MPPLVGEEEPGVCSGEAPVWEEGAESLNMFNLRGCAQKAAVT